MIKRMNFTISYIFRKLNQCANKIANLGLQIVNYHWWNTIPSNIVDVFNRNMICLPEYIDFVDDCMLNMCIKTLNDTHC